MTSITGTAYNVNNPYYYPSEETTNLSRVSATASENEAKSTTVTTDTVTLSKDVARAKTREAMGLNPTGRLKLEDFKIAAAKQEETIKSMLGSAMENLGIDMDQQVSLTLDADYRIVIGENFSGKKELENVLNDDGAFELEFKGLSTNSEITNYVKDLQTRTPSFADYFNADISQDDLLSLASKYADIKSSGNSLETLMGISRSEQPYTFVHTSTEQPG